MITLKPFKNNVMFEFLDDTIGKQGHFHAKTSTGIILVSSVDANKVHRWGRVLASGPESEVIPGDLILVEALMWMEGNKVDGVRMWKTDDSRILAVAETIADCQVQST